MSGDDGQDISQMTMPAAGTSVPLPTQNLIFSDGLLTVWDGQ